MKNDRRSRTARRPSLQACEPRFFLGGLAFLRSPLREKRDRVALIVFALGLFAAAARADVTLPAIFSDHMVLQQEARVPIWGWADPGERVEVTMGKVSASAVTSADGTWRAVLDPVAPGSADRLVVRGKNTITINDVLIGEVWLCAGQSNMNFRLSRVNEAGKERAAAKHPQIRVFETTSGPARTPQARITGKWVVCSPETAGTFSAVAYFFSLYVAEELHRPVGAIVAAWGGTPIETWMSLESQRDIPEMKRVFDTWSARLKEWNPQQAQRDHEQKLARYKVGSERAKAAGTKAPREPKAPVVPDLDPNHPATLFHGKIAPLVPFALRGVLWYQGESSATLPEAFAYKQQLAALVTDWRRRWSQPDLPFAWVQLPNFKRDAEAWPLVREAMLESLALPHTGMAVAIDVGNPDDIHPTNKRPVGQRLARWALAEVYGRGGPSSSPLPAGHTFEGARAIVAFAHADGGLVVRGGALTGFTLAGEDRQWHPATATIDGNRVFVTSAAVPKPVAVRYAWSDNPTCNLYSGAGFPASPFRTDRWPAPEAVAKPGVR